jgi:hypothetical protein
MSDSSVVSPDVPVSESNSLRLPVGAIVRAVCEAANGGPDLLYEVMIKVSLMVEATAPTYGQSGRLQIQVSRHCAGQKDSRTRRSRLVKVQ